MELFLFTNYFPFKKSEPFLVNEFEFTKKYFNSISVLALYGEIKDSRIESGTQVSILEPVLSAPTAKDVLFFKGIFNFSDIRFHVKDFFKQGIYKSIKKSYWFFTSLLVTRTILSSCSYTILLSKIRKSKNPVLYFYWADNLCWIIPYLKRSLKDQPVKIVVRLHRTDLYEHLKANYAPLRQEIFSLTDLIVAISNDGKDYLIKNYPAFRNKIVLSRLGVFDHGLNPFIFNEVKQIVSVSAIVEVKRVHLIFELLQKMSSKIVWHHFGDGPMTDHLKTLIMGKRRNLDVILHGYVDNSQLMNFYKSQSVDFLMNVSSSEGLPVSIMEALSFGVPVVATDVGGTREMVDDRVGKLISSDFDMTSVAIDIEKLLNQETEKILLMRKNARNYYESRVSAEINYANFYGSIVGDFK